MNLDSLVKFHFKKKEHTLAMVYVLVHDYRESVYPQQHISVYKYERNKKPVLLDEGVFPWGHAMVMGYNRKEIDLFVQKSIRDTEMWEIKFWGRIAHNYRFNHARKVGYSAQQISATKSLKKHKVQFLDWLLANAEDVLGMEEKVNPNYYEPEWLADISNLNDPFYLKLELAHISALNKIIALNDTR